MILPVLDIALGFAFGLAVGLVHFLSLRRVTALWLSGRAPRRALALHFGRLAALGAGLFGLALIGAVALVAGAMGVIVAREIVLHGARKEATWTAR
ncbi:MAG: hypothetical protein KDK53_16360 [Maritimibacter sp.]|nr:hypothetical protein [Maritimibacter sp.]